MTDDMEVKANLEWIEQEWRRFTRDPRGQRALVAPTFDPAAVAKLFAAFCLERLAMEHEADDALTGDVQ